MTSFKSWIIDRATAILLCFLVRFVEVSGHFLELKTEPLRSRYRDILVLSSSLGEVNRSIRKAVPSSLAALRSADLNMQILAGMMNSFELGGMVSPFHTFFVRSIASSSWTKATVRFGMGGFVYHTLCAIKYVSTFLTK